MTYNTYLANVDGFRMCVAVSGTPSKPHSMTMDELEAEGCKLLRAKNGKPYCAQHDFRIQKYINKANEGR